MGVFGECLGLGVDMCRRGGGQTLKGVFVELTADEKKVQKRRRDNVSPSF